MQVTPQALQAPQAAAAAPQSAPKPAGTAQAPFANLLRQSQSAQQAAPAEPTAAEPDAESPSDAPAGPDAPPKVRLKPAEKSTAPRAADRSARTGAVAEANPGTAAADTAEGSLAKRGDMPVAEPSLAPWLLALQHPTVTPVAAGAGTASDTAAQVAGAGTVSDTTAQAAGAGSPSSTEPVPFAPADNVGLVKDKAADDMKARLDPNAASPTNAVAWAAATSATSASSANNVGVERAGQHASEEQRSARPISTDANTSAAALGATTFNPLTGSVRESAMPLAVNVPTPLASPEFAQALGVQMSVLATDGVQHAELQLNPAEMGPVSVQIVIDGTSAHVDFGADLAATRQAIEAGLPELAGALRDAGFTLTGGGVSQHSGGRSGAQDPGRDPGGNARRGIDAGAATAGAAGAARLRRTVSAGGIDLYA
ncbi:MAG: flagellar hook-length control protein FliK [Burkholderiaceae bacterium]